MNESLDIDNEIAKLKAEAVRLLDGMLNIPDGYSSDATNRIVECIVSAAILEVRGLARDPNL